jgi:predicted RND superfamily exporter protein
LAWREAMVSAVREAGPAMVMTTVVVCAGFSPLLASRFEVLFLVGLMTMVSATTALAADLFVFPALLAVSRTAQMEQSQRARARKPEEQVLNVT